MYKKIAAGEVVERPLSAVKELVENSIDAGADVIKVELMDGGKRLIKITDNGHGFHPDDIETAFKNHSTSKLSNLEDFDSLFTLGFRGEALPSILEVSKIEICSSNNTDGVGVRCRFDDALLQEREEVAFSRGSSILVEDLFYNFPVRKKFLKADRTELKQIVS
ncbi:MAG: DNA mismatch repair protein MutL, partial [bacterium]|nr:DNA mismatch repair protein MutL [bacterium]